MDVMMNLKHMGLLAVFTLVLFVGVSPLHAYPANLPCLAGVSPPDTGDDRTGQTFQLSSVLSFDIEVAGKLMPGVLGLPGEPVTWVITVKNAGQVVGQDVVVTDTVHETQRIDTTQTTHGSVSVSEQVVVFSIPVLNPGETAELVIETTVLQSPFDGKLVNQVLVAAVGPDGAVAQHMAAEVFVPNGLPATGYAQDDEDLPGEGEPSVVAFGVGAFGVVGLVATFVWYRGRRRL